jgi:uncharacterized protein (DUF362 family)/Pyruvate/2-oxoacid:ferredoxin oxidoreductase delta subunit
VEKMAIVALVRCNQYEYGTVLDAVKKGISLIGGADQFAKPGETILLKPNMLVGDPPEKCSTTNPMVFNAVAEVFLTTKATLTYGDSPGFGQPDAVAKKTGIMAVADSLGIPLADFVNGREVDYPQAKQNKHFYIANGVLTADGIISLPKMKTHGFAKMTGSVKNQFGCIPGFRKAEYHVLIPDLHPFSRMLVDLNKLIKPRLFIMDGILAMEGNGPRGGKPFPMNVLLFSSDPIALDATVCRMIALHPQMVPTIVYGQKAGLGTYLESEIQLVGDPLTSCIKPNFRVNRDKGRAIKLPGSGKWIRNRFIPKPTILKKKCIRCGVCVTVCPVTPKALNWSHPIHVQPPQYRYDRCIRCFCCQELCPESAIIIRKSITSRLISRLVQLRSP